MRIKYCQLEFHLNKQTISCYCHFLGVPVPFLLSLTVTKAMATADSSAKESTSESLTRPRLTFQLELVCLVCVHRRLKFGNTQRINITY